ncbi:MAG: thermonuclease family protein [Halobacteriovoraceae bacterium]|jgi:micrococcal nuclease|nr:thermonuclease family protein [Halobacteriovoraceae bacterium]MBT5093159.1 thermonuclease family protein [Halobacteriovoraceae bacterium]
MRYLLFFIPFLVATLAYTGEKGCQHDGKNFRCVKYVRNYDADTVTFNIPGTHPLFGKKINIRVKGVDTPELRTKNKCEKEKARSAKKLVKSLFRKARRIDLTDVSRGKYFRIVADIIIDGKSLKNYLLKNGLAYPYDGGTKRKMDWCKPSREIASENQ